MEKYLNTINNYTDNDLKYISNEIKNGKLAIIPTDTVYGIACNALNEDSVKKVFDIKNRSLSNPINLLVSDIDMIKKITKNISDIEYMLLQAFLPGPFTLILEKSDIIPNIVTANSKYVGIRIADNVITNKLIEYAGVPFAVPSANLSGKLSATNVEDILSDFDNMIDYIIDNGSSKIGLESTIVKVIDNIPHILRLGAITEAEISAITNTVVVETNSSPSSNLKHYEINTPCFVYFSEENEKMINSIIEKSQHYENITIICCIENMNMYEKLFKQLNTMHQYPKYKYILIPYGSNMDMYSISKNLFHSISIADKNNSDILLIEGVSRSGIGETIMNRLLQTCNNNYFHIQ